MGQVTTAMLLAAGEGRRMRPLTENTPKPLLKVGEYSLIEHQLFRLKQAGIESVVVNIAYLGDQIKSSLGDGRQYGLSIMFSEENEPLETGGGISKALPLLEKFSSDGRFVLVNADIWSDYPLQLLTQRELPEEVCGHLIMVPNPEHNQTGDFYVNSEGYLTCLNHKLQNNRTAPNTGAPLSTPDLGTYNSGTYSGLALLRTRLISEYPERRAYFGLREVFDYFLGRKQLTAEMHTGDWRDIGTPERLDQLRHAYRCQNPVIG
ncbi:nucleotidyltransferase family protein [Marinibactrum halimedae]|uniref:Nucleotidyltransferase n=1 Tax=Marinibactrum halimedae TaxID=1444977 RepID=A0AA37T2E8_9GAMM|nr:nucleotidyltransferase family protein [Marinibactrum halimedae]MCD9459564.1 nucleotidyltransferase family protein [Marinibactrum halimedae]GLS25619.1 nucleotidyltransferase [Marinibactrum halimedae]